MRHSAYLLDWAISKPHRAVVYLDVSGQGNEQTRSYLPFTAFIVDVWSVATRAQQAVYLLTFSTYIIQPLDHQATIVDVTTSTSQSLNSLRGGGGLMWKTAGCHTHRRAPHTMMALSNSFLHSKIFFISCYWYSSGPRPQETKLATVTLRIFLSFGTFTAKVNLPPGCSLHNTGYRERGQSPRTVKENTKYSTRVFGLPLTRNLSWKSVCVWCSKSSHMRKHST